MYRIAFRHNEISEHLGHPCFEIEDGLYGIKIGESIYPFNKLPSQEELDAFRERIGKEFLREIYYEETSYGYELIIFLEDE